ncbi:hypothetical protein MFIFM68171_11221 [Madurella fahalii]|uniref:HPP transmembrane region domain-containing protein n=1 Tax=Madurella fahalii TaxID=1157608 RepID=A0ABQ0GTD8_9PEZI
MMIPKTSGRGPSRWHFDIDEFLNPFFPVSILPRLPHPVAHFLGYRTHHLPPPLGNVAMIFWAFIGIFSSLIVIGAVGVNVPAFRSLGVPTIIGSFGAAAVLDFYAIESPLAQPRNAIIGQMVSAVTGVGLCKLFALSPHFESIRWVGASLACATATALMALTGTVHPPAGATALMAVVDDDVAQLGWFLLLPLLLGCVLMLCVALLVNNVQRRFPYYWWSPQETGEFWKRRMDEVTEGKRATKKGEYPSASSETSGDLEATAGEESDTGGELARTNTTVEYGPENQILITRGRVVLPEGLSLRPEEILSLETLSERL